MALRMGQVPFFIVASQRGRDQKAVGGLLWPLLTGWPRWAGAWVTGTGGGLSAHALPTDLEEGHYAIAGDGLQQARGPREALQPSPAGREEGSDDDNPGGRKEALSPGAPAWPTALPLPPLAPTPRAACQPPPSSPLPSRLAIPQHTVALSPRPCKPDRKNTRLNSSHRIASRMPSSA